MAQKPSIPKGTRDFGSLEMARRNYIFDTIRSVYRLYGFSQIETPAMENLSTLMGKYGEEGDKLLFKILNSGDFTRSVSTADYEEASAAALAAKFCEKGLRYDLTVPFARYVVQHREELQMPFKRYQIQPVWRADRPQKGRYREFYQCDADVVGSDSLLNEVELMQIVDEVFTRFGIRVAIKINNRKILTGIAEVIGAADKIVDITVAIDKLDKIGLDKVNEELAAGGLSPEQIQTLQPIIALSGSNADKLNTMRQVLASSEVGLKGCEEVEFVLNCLGDDLTNVIELDLTLARGLNYYTGCIFEVKALDVEIGSITGGGRYDNLTGIFGLPGLSGVGISFGADRIYDVLNQLELYPADTASGVDLLFINFGEAEAACCLRMARQTRAAGISTEVFPDAAKMKKQMNYANTRNIPFVALVGESEMAAGTIALKNMTTGEQSTCTLDEVIARIKG
ncbi:histidine--tRNA ligase [Alloprevotella sp. Lung230]|jgi:histidine--tRNA ligase|uniref:histidine--tRNA ligase n=1 Tax=Alloprevotella sp. Lung230 TaxID=2766595 RepID=UPI001655EF6F|nr:histidine--tRNA ligase [Alloprevotella sp. Lung230]MBC8626195.1 histidine--tRNA ligase [Alloprevotella sp. Lung230]